MDGKRIKPTPGFKRSVCAVAALLSFLPVSAPSAATPNSEFVQAIYRGEATPQRNNAPTATDPDIERRFNDLRRELLDDRSKEVGWWLAATAIFLTLISVLGVLGGYFGFRRFREIEAEVRENANKVRESADNSQRYASEVRALASEARKNVEESQQHASKSGALAKEIQEARDAVRTFENTTAEPDRDVDIAQGIGDNSEASLLRKAVSAAITLQNDGNMEIALEKWRAVAHILEGSDSDLERHAWFSVGYLSNEGDSPDRKAAIDAYDKAIQLQPDYAAAYNNRGSAKAGLGRYDEAIADCDKAIQLQPDYAAAYNNRGNAKAGLGRYDEAIADYDKAIRLNPDYAAAYYNRGNAKAGLGRHDEAIADYDKAIRLNPDDAAAYNNRGSAKNNLGRCDEAIADYDKAIRLNPDDAAAYNNRGNAKDNLGRCDEAIADYDKAIQINLDYAGAFYNRGVAKHRQGLLQEARSDIEAALALARDANNDDLASRAQRYLESMP